MNNICGGNQPIGLVIADYSNWLFGDRQNAQHTVMAKVPVPPPCPTGQLSCPRCLPVLIFVALKKTDYVKERVASHPPLPLSLNIIDESCRMWLSGVGKVVDRCPPRDFPYIIPSPNLRARYSG